MIEQQTTDDPLADVKIGDSVDGYLAETDDLCWARIPGSNVLGASTEYSCNRDRGHPGQHIAQDPHQVVGVSPQASTS